MACLSDVYRIGGLDFILVDRCDHKTGVKTGSELFCPTTGEFYRKGLFTRKQKKHFRIIRSGFELCYARNEKLSFLTLTTQYDVKTIDGVPIVDKYGNKIPLYPRKMHEKRKGINKAFTKLKQMIERKIQSIMYQRYCKRHNMEPYCYIGARSRKKIKYQLIYQKFKYKLRYFKVKTSEGGGVLHIVFRKAYNVPMLPFHWLRMAWFRLWGAKHGVNIKSCRVSDAEGLSMYMVGQYFAKQPVLRMSYGYSWACVGLKKRLDRLITDYGYKKAVSRYIGMMQYNMRPTGSTGYQRRLVWRKPRNINYKHLRLMCECYQDFRFKLMEVVSGQAEIPYYGTVGEKKGFTRPTFNYDWLETEKFPNVHYYKYKQLELNPFYIYCWEHPDKPIVQPKRVYQPTLQSVLSGKPMEKWAVELLHNVECAKKLNSSGLLTVA